jgi:hypothetical protein
MDFNQGENSMTTLNEATIEQLEAQLALCKLKVATELAKNRQARLQEGNALLADAVKKFELALTEAESIADKYGLSFNIYPSYGMGGSYSSEDGWTSSSNNC